MFDPRDPQSLENRLQEKLKRRRQRRLDNRHPDLPKIDASKFTQPIADLAQAVINQVEREGRTAFGDHIMQGDIAAILIQLKLTYDLLRFISSDETRDENYAYRTAYSFVALPLVRTMIDGFYNCTALLDDPSRVTKFRASGLYRMRDAIKADEERYGEDPRWKDYLPKVKQDYQKRMKDHNLSEADLDDKRNKWPLLGVYLDAKPHTPHKEMLRTLTLGFWKEYSSISHASYDGILNIFHFIATDRLPQHVRPIIYDAAERHIGVHLCRAAGVLLSLLTEIQHFCKFEEARIDQRLSEMWSAILPVVEVKELFDHRYHKLLRVPLAEHEK